ncbi:MAG: hypothetical protein ACFFC1_03275, partial [Promethearchaeota archaeon]
VLIVIGIVVILLFFLLGAVGILLFFPLGVLGSVVGIVLFSIGVRFVIYSSRKTREQLPVQLQEELYAKEFKLKKSSGISLTVIGIAFIILVGLLWIIGKNTGDPYWFGTMYGIYIILLWFIGPILFFAGVGLWGRSASIKKRMKKLEES